MTDPAGLSPEVICEEICGRWFDPGICECYCDWWSRQNHRDLTYWLANEMHANANGPEARTIRRLIEKAKDPFSLIPSIPSVNPTFGERMTRLGMLETAAVNWALLVGDGKRWDFKDATRRELELIDEGHRSIWLQTGILMPGRYRTSGDWLEYSVPGNIHYGYVGRASGWSADDLHIGASFAEVTDPDHRDKAQICLPRPFPCVYFNLEFQETLFDNPQDYNAVELGSRLFDLFGFSVPIEGFKVMLTSYRSLLAHEAPPLDADTYVNWAWPYPLGYFDGRQ
jgi:hypothetical protein